MILMALDWQRLGWTDPQYIPHPRTYLSQGRWLDEPAKPLPTLGHAVEPWWQECQRLHGRSPDGGPKCVNLAWHQVVLSREP